MSSHSCEYPIVVSPDDVDPLDHAPLAESAIAWDAFVLLLVTAFSSYVS